MARDSSECIVTLKDVSFSYQIGTQCYPVLSELDLAIRRGELLAIQGPSGSGKSTLFYLIGCLMKPTSGGIYFNGADISTYRELELAQFRNQHVGFVFQQFHLLARASVLENILLPSRYPVETAVPGERSMIRAKELAARLGLMEFLSKLPQQLSGGQQQRVAIARALMQGADLILADEPTGNLDTQNAGEVLKLFKELKAEGKTVVLITHDRDVAAGCDRILHFRDGKMNREEILQASDQVYAPAGRPKVSSEASTNSLKLRTMRATLPIVFANLVRNRTKSLLTMLGVTIGVAAVLAMLSMGQFAKRRILEGYEALGVNKLQIYGSRNWRLKPGEAQVGNPFQSFSWTSDLEPLKVLFPEVALVSPVLSSWGASVEFGGKLFKDDLRLSGVNEEYLQISNGKVAYGRFFSQLNVERNDKVCVLGADFPTQLGTTANRLIGEFIMVKLQERISAACIVIGILKTQGSNKEWFKPDRQILMPYTTHMSIASSWDRRITQFVLKVKSADQVEDTSIKIKNYFKARYGNSGEFDVDSDTTMVAQMKRFLNIFSILLAAIAFLSLFVGGIGIHNMMLVSVADRLKEIGLRKAMGATAQSLKWLFLSESLVLCLIAGAVGLLLGFVSCQLGIFAATKLIKGLTFEWVFEPLALLISVVAMVTVGILSGLVPARRAERLTVIEALRSE